MRAVDNGTSKSSLLVQYRHSHRYTNSVRTGDYQFGVVLVTIQEIAVFRSRFYNVVTSGWCGALPTGETSRVVSQFVLRPVEPLRNRNLILSFLSGGFFMFWG